MRTWLTLVVAMVVAAAAATAVTLFLVDREGHTVTADPPTTATTLPTTTVTTTTTTTVPQTTVPTTTTVPPTTTTTTTTVPPTTTTTTVPTTTTPTLVPWTDRKFRSWSDEDPVLHRDIEFAGQQVGENQLLLICQPDLYGATLWILVFGEETPRDPDLADYTTATVTYRIGFSTYEDGFEFEYQSDLGRYYIEFPERIIDQFYARTGDEFIVRSGLPGLYSTETFNLRDMEYAVGPVIDACTFSDDYDY